MQHLTIERSQRPLGPCRFNDPHQGEPICTVYLPLFSQLDHPDRRLVAAGATESASKRRRQFPDRRIAGPTNGIQGHARPGLAPATLDLQPASHSRRSGIDRSSGMVERVRRSPSSGPTRPGPVGCTSRPFGFLAGDFGALLCAHDPATPYDLAGFVAHVHHLDRLARPGNFTSLRGWEQFSGATGTGCV